MKKEIERKVTILFSDENLEAVETIDELFLNIYKEYYNLVADETENGKDIINKEEIESALKASLIAITELLTVIHNYCDMEP